MRGRSSSIIEKNVSKQGNAVISRGRGRSFGKRLTGFALAAVMTFTGLNLPGISTGGTDAGLQEVYADDFVNTVPVSEAPDGNFYSTEITTGFSKNQHNSVAQYGPGYGPYTVDGVYQSLSTQSPTSFAAGLPLGTISIDQSKIGDTFGTVKFISDDTAILAGLVFDAPNNTVQYDGTKDGAIKLEPGKINRLDGDLFTVTFPDAAIKPSGERADLVITYSNARIVVDQRYAYAPEGERYLHGAAYLAKGNAFKRGSTDMTNFSRVASSSSYEAPVNATAASFGSSFANQNARYPAVGTTLDATYQIYNKDGTLVSGTFVFAICGINLDRDPDVGGGNNIAKPIWYSYDEDFGGENGKEYSFFSEAMSINSGQVSDYVYVRPNTPQEDNPDKITGVKGQYFWPYVKKDERTGAVKFISNALNSPNIGGNDNSYNAGFVTLADATGFTVTATGHGGGIIDGNMHSHVFNSKQIWYRYTSSTGPHGNIETTSEGNYNKQLTDGGDVLEPGTYVVTEGKTVTYTMTPDIGYKISTLKVNGEEVKFDDKSVNSMKKGDTTTFTTAAGKTGTLKYEEDGTYSFIFPYAEHDEKIHVEWEPTTADVLYFKIWDDENDKDGMRIGADGTEEWPKVSLQQSIDGGASWTYVDANAFGSSVTPQDVPSGKDEESGSSTYGQYLDGIYEKNNDTTGVHPHTWGTCLSIPMTPTVRQTGLSCTAL